MDSGIIIMCILVWLQLLTVISTIIQIIKPSCTIIIALLLLSIIILYIQGIHLHGATSVYRISALLMVVRMMSPLTSMVNSTNKILLQPHRPDQ